jgi:hypothetical protein
MGNILVREQIRSIQATPAVQTDTAKHTQKAVRLVLAMRPQFRNP